MKEARTLNGLFDARCQHCLRAVYRLCKERPPKGCAEGHDDDISKCGAVYNALVGIVIRQDHLKQPLVEEQTFLLAQLGPKADELLAHIRSGKEPPHHKSLEPDYDAPAPTAQ
jgi:hypothetical protein